MASLFHQPANDIGPHSPQADHTYLHSSDPPSERRQAGMDIPRVYIRFNDACVSECGATPPRNMFRETLEPLETMIVE
jgi:hypothetical protein